MKKLLYIFLAFPILFSSCSLLQNEAKPIIELKTEHFNCRIDDKGKIIELCDLKNQQNYLSKDTTSFLMKLRVENKIKVPIAAKVEKDIISLIYDPHFEAQIKIEEKETHLTFELLSLSNHENIDLIIWGPYCTNIKKIIGETVGVVRGDSYAIGIQSLNLKTLGGYPWNESDRMPAFDIFREEDINNMHPKSEGSVLYRVEAGKPTKNGSSLQAYCRNRNKDRIIQDFNHDRLVAPAYHDGGVIGSKIALFGCPVEKALETLGKIEIAEDLPHPMVEGEWGKKARQASAAYLITNFTENNIDKAIALTRKAGLKHLYHYGKTFDNWGHFNLYTGEFPNGIKGLKMCVEKAEKEDIIIGTHCLSNFISTNDPYVTPIPSRNLAKVGSSIILEDIDVDDSEIFIQSPEFFNQIKNNHLKTVMIGTELIRYAKVSESAPWKLMDCQRGAFQTKKSSHQKEDTISKLLDHAYKVFLTNAELTIEMSKTLAQLYNETGMRQISFDGLEGNRSSGLGTYGESLMPYTWYQSLNEELKNNLIIDASRTTHFFWHIYTRMNWGEPWYGGFRESQTEYRFKNQAYFKRNFMPGMLGWFKFTSETSVEDISWMLARSAAYDAGYALVANMEQIEQNGKSEDILELIGHWEKLRLGGAFSENQKEKMRQTDKEFVLLKSPNNKWTLQEIHAEIFHHKKKVKQPGEPLHSEFTFNNLGEEQSIQFILSAIDCKVNNIELEINNYKKIPLPITLNQGEIIQFIKGDKAIVYDKNWRILNEFDLAYSDLLVNSGENTISIDCEFEEAKKGSKLKLEIRSEVANEAVITPL